MNIAEIISLTRNEILDDIVAPYLWTNAGLVAHFNRAYDELTRETYCIVDSSTVSVCQVPLLANQSLHATSPKMLKILNAWLNSNGYPLDRKTEAYIGGYFNWRATMGTSPYWLVVDSQNRHIIPYPKYDTTGYLLDTFAMGGWDGEESKILLPTGGLSTHFAKDDVIVVSAPAGAGVTVNSGTYTITSIDSDIQMKVGSELIDELGVSAIIQKVRDIVLMRVARLPLVTYTVSDLGLPTPPTPELDATYHYGLLDGVAKYAYLKQDSETYDSQKSKQHGDAFEEFKSQVALEMAILMEGDAVCTPHLGTL